MKVLGYNIREGGDDRLPVIANVIRERQPDVVALLEANVRDSAATLAEDLGMRLVFGEANSEYHVARLSRLPIRRSENHRLPILAKTLLEIEVAWRGTPLSLFATHLGSRWDVHRPSEETPAVLDVLRCVAGRPHLL